MASKRKVRRKIADARPQKKVSALYKRTRADVAKLLGRHRAGTITHAELESGLKEVKKRMDRMFFWFFFGP